MRKRVFFGAFGLFLFVLVSAGRLQPAVAQQEIPPELVSDSLRIVSPTERTVVAPGQTITVLVQAPSDAFSHVGVIGENMGFSETKTTPPFEFSLVIPNNFAGPKKLTAVGIVRPGRGLFSRPVTIIVEPPVPLTELRVDLAQIKLGLPGQQTRLFVTGIFANGTALDITKSPDIRFTSTNTAVAVVDSTGLVEAVAEGTATITVTYKARSVAVPVKVEFQRQSIKIDIRPGDSNNRINLDSGGSIPVAILTTDTFDVTRVDPLTVRFGPNGAMEEHGRGHFEDVDGDGFSDMVLHFRQPEIGIACHQTLATLTGSTFDGVLIKGTDFIRPRGSNCIEIPRR